MEYAGGGGGGGGGAYTRFTKNAIINVGYVEKLSPLMSKLPQMAHKNSKSYSQ